MRKFRERLPPACAYLILRSTIVLTFLVGLLVCSFVGVLVCGCIDVGPSNATERAWISAARAAAEAPYLGAPSTSARIQNRVDFVELARDTSSNCTGEVQAGIAISGWYQLVPRTHYISSRI